MIHTPPTVISDNDVRKVGSLAGSSFLRKYFGIGWGSKASPLWHQLAGGGMGLHPAKSSLGSVLRSPPFKNLSGETTHSGADAAKSLWRDFEVPLRFQPCTGSLRVDPSTDGAARGTARGQQRAHTDGSSKPGNFWHSASRFQPNISGPVCVPEARGMS